MTSQKGRFASRASFACVRCKRAKQRCDISQIAAEGSEQPCTACQLRNEKCEVIYGEDRRRGRHRQKNKVVHPNHHEEPTSSVRGVLDIETTESPDVPDRDTDVSNDLDDPSSTLTADLTQTHTEHNQQTTLASPLSPSDSVHPRHPTFQALLSAALPAMPADASLENMKDSQTQNTRTESSRSAVSSQGIRSRGLRGLTGFPAVLDEVPAPETSVERRRDKSHNNYFGSSSMFPYSERKQNGHASTDATERINRQATSHKMCPSALEDFTEPEPIVAHLLDLFWNWQLSHLIAIDPALFLKHRQLAQKQGDSGDRNFYTPCLLYAIIALAAMISPDRGVRRYCSSSNGLPGEEFLQRAKILFDVEMESPTVTTVQAALVIGSRYGTLVDNNLGWIYSGIALRIASKIGLHLDCTSAVQSGYMTEEVASIRKTAYWGCYVEDKLWSAYCSRPTTMMDWDNSITEPQPRPDLPPFTSAFLPQSTVSLTKLIGKAQLGLYAQRKKRTHGKLKLLAFEIHRELSQWHQQLPADLKWPSMDNTAPSSAHILILHMQFYFSLILIHRPFLRFSKIQEELLKGAHAPLNSTTTCAIAATNTAKIVRDYRKYYSIKQISPVAVHFIFISTTIHIINFRLTRQESHHTLLRGCMSALSEMASSYPIADKAVSVLQSLMECWKPSYDSDESDEETDRPGYRSDSGNFGPGNGSNNIGLPSNEVSVWTARRDDSLLNFDQDIEVPPLLDFQGLINTDTDTHSTSASGDFPIWGQSLDLYDYGQAFTATQYSMPDGERSLFDAFYGTSFGLN